MPRRDLSRRSIRVPRLLERVIQQRRRPESGPEQSRPATATRPDDEADVEQRLQALDARLERLESLVEGLQDSVHRESSRHQREIEDLQYPRAGS
jgi:predicted RNase H-like nuclease (RuvC/YqgF family)